MGYSKIKASKTVEVEHPRLRINSSVINVISDDYAHIKHTLSEKKFVKNRKIAGSAVAGIPM